MRPHSYATGEGKGREARFEDRLQNLRQRVMDHSVPERSRRNQTRLRIEQLERPVGAGRIATLQELLLNLQQIPFEIEKKSGHIRPAAFTRGRSVGRPCQIPEAGQLRPQMTHASHEAGVRSVALGFCCAALCQPPAIRPISSSFSTLKPHESTDSSRRSLARRSR